MNQLIMIHLHRKKTEDYRVSTNPPLVPNLCIQKNMIRVKLDNKWQLFWKPSNFDKSRKIWTYTFESAFEVVEDVLSEANLKKIVTEGFQVLLLSTL